MDTPTKDGEYTMSSILACPLYTNVPALILRHQLQPCLQPGMMVGLDCSLVAPPLHKGEGSGMVPLLEFCWNAINLRKLAFTYARFTLCGDTLTTAHGLHAAHSMLVYQVSAVVVCACISRTCCSQKICIFMFPRISGEKNNSSNGAIPDPPLCEGAAPRD